LMLDEFGRSGLGRDLERVAQDRHSVQRKGEGRNTRCKEGGAP
jgi:hypothetical protein